MKDKELELIVLTIIKTKGNLYNLLAAGISNQEILRCIHYFIETNIIARINGDFSITDTSYWERLNKEFSNKGLYKYLIPELFYRKEKLKIEEIYIPLYENKK